MSLNIAKNNKKRVVIAGGGFGRYETDFHRKSGI